VTNRPLFQCAIIVIGALIASASPASAQESAACTVSGSITTGATPLPGVSLTLVNAAGDIVGAGSSGSDGRYVLKAPGPGTYQLKSELLRFAPAARDVTLSNTCRTQVDLSLTLNSRSGTSAAARRPLERAPAGAETPRPRARQGRGDNRRVPFQPLALIPDAPSPGADATDADAGAQMTLPAGFSLDASADSVTTVGETRAANGMGPGERFDPAQFGDGIPGGFSQGEPGGGFGPGGRGAGPGGGGPRGGFGGLPAFGRAGRNQIRGSVNDGLSASALDASPFSINGQPTIKPEYFQQRLGGTIGGPLSIPGLYHGDGRTFFFANYSGNHSSNPYDAYATVPTAAARTGDLSFLTTAVRNPFTGAPFVNNQIPGGLLNPSAQSLLSLLPLPNQTGTTRNYHYVTTTDTNTDDVNLRFVHTFGQTTNERPGGPRGMGRAGGFGRGGGARGGSRSNLNVAIHVRHSDADSAGAFPTVGGSSTTTAWDVPVSISSSLGKFLNTARAQVNRQRRDSTNLYAGTMDIAGAAGLVSASTDPFDWGAPNLSFTTISSLSDVQPSFRRDLTLTLGDTLVRTFGTHTVNVGGEYRSNSFDSRSDANARGSYVFTGLQTGSDLGDFLLGLPQQASIQYGAGLEHFSATSWSTYAQDDWRVSGRWTINAGLRYEYQSPYAERDNRLVTLDLNPTFTEADAVQAGASGLFNGVYPDTIVTPDRNNVAPRIGVAWRANQQTVVRGGYGVGYNLGVYQRVAQQLATQPPFSTTNTVIGTADAPLALATALAGSSSATTNTYAIDPSFTLPYVQTWNLDTQYDIHRTLSIGIGYLGSKGSNLQLVRAPNRTATGLRLDTLPAFLYETNGGSSTMHGLTLRMRKRPTHGIGFNANYTFSDAHDSASSIGGGASTVAQNDEDLAAEWGLSSFNQRHRFSGSLMLELPFGADRRWFTTGPMAALLGNWTWNTSVQLASGLPFTARVLGGIGDVAGGTNGTLRADYNGQPIALDDPTTLQFFNTAAFSIPAPGTYGNAARNTIVGPGTENVTMRLTRAVSFGQFRVLSVDLVASNVFNTVQYSAIDTIVNSPTFGQVVGARSPRRLQLMLRLRF
jgi:hypothetical protein